MEQPLGKKLRTASSITTNQVHNPLGLLPCLLYDVVLPFLTWQDCMTFNFVHKATRNAAAKCGEFHVFGLSLGAKALAIMQWFNGVNTRPLKRIVIKNLGDRFEGSILEEQLQLMIQRSLGTLECIDIDCWCPIPSMLTLVGQCVKLQEFSGLHYIDQYHQRLSLDAWSADMSLRVLNIYVDLDRQRYMCGAGLAAAVKWLISLVEIFGRTLEEIRVECNRDMLQQWLKLDKQSLVLLKKLELVVVDLEDDTNDSKMKADCELAIQLAQRCSALQFFSLSASFFRCRDDDRTNLVDCSLKLPYLQRLELHVPVAPTTGLCLPQLKSMAVPQSWRLASEWVCFVSCFMSVCVLLMIVCIAGRIKANSWSGVYRQQNRLALFYHSSSLPSLFCQDQVHQGRLVSSDSNTSRIGSRPLF